MRSFFADLPPELVDGIIDNIADDVTSLKACTTVCSAWISRSRFHLFSTLRVSGPPDTFANFVGFLQTTTTVHQRDVPGRTQSGLCMVRTLNLDGKGFAQKPRLTLGTLQTILRHLPCLRALHLHALRLDDVDFVSGKAVPLQELTLVSVDAHNQSSEGGELLAVLSLFSRIDSLLLRFAHFNNFPLTHEEARTHTLFDKPDGRYPAKLEVYDLRLHLPRHTVFFLELFRRIPTRRALRSMRVTCRSTEKFQAIGAFCRDPDIGQSLEHLEVDLKYCIPQNVTDIPLLTTIGHLDALKSVVLSGLCLTLNTIGVDFNIFGIILPLLSSAPVGTLRFTTILLLMEPPDAASHIFERDASNPNTISPWEQIEGTALERELNLKPEVPMVISIVFRSPFFAMGITAESIGRIGDCIRSEMPTLSSRGLLELRFEEEYNF